MNHSLFAVFGAVAVAGTMTLSAQTPPPTTPRPQTPTPPSSTPSRTNDKTITLTGCLKAQDASMDRPTSTSGSSAAGKFILTNIEGTSMGAARPEATTPGSPTPSGTPNASGKQYALTADAGVNLAAHVNHQVRVTGTLSDMDDHSTTHADPAARPGDPAKPGTTGRPGEPTSSGDRMGTEKAGSTLAVSSVTMLNSSCTPTR